MMGARRAVASMVGAAVADGLEMGIAPDDRGQPRANCKKKKITCFLTPGVNPQNSKIIRIRNN